MYDPEGRREDAFTLLLMRLHTHLNSRTRVHSRAHSNGSCLELPLVRLSCCPLAAPLVMRYTEDQLRVCTDLGEQVPVPAPLQYSNAPSQAAIRSYRGLRRAQSAKGG